MNKIVYITAAAFICGCLFAARDFPPLQNDLPTGTNSGLALSSTASDAAPHFVQAEQQTDLKVFGFSEEEIKAMPPDHREVYQFYAPYLSDGWKLPPAPDSVYPSVRALTEAVTEMPGALTPVLYPFGSTSRATPLLAISLEPESWNRTLMLTFAVHGFEGFCEGDGGFLTRYACQIALFYSCSPAHLNTTRLIIIPMANPDGVLASTRNQADDIDMNRDFKNSRFRAPESRALRELITREQPDILIDFHGWYQECYGDPEVTEVFVRYLKIPHSDTCTGKRQGYLVGYARGLGLRTALVEYGGVRKSNVPKTILALNELMSS